MVDVSSELIMLCNLITSELINILYSLLYFTKCVLVVDKYHDFKLFDVHISPLYVTAA